MSSPACSQFGDSDNEVSTTEEESDSEPNTHPTLQFTLKMKPDEADEEESQAPLGEDESPSVMAEEDPVMANTPDTIGAHSQCLIEPDKMGSETASEPPSSPDILSDDTVDCVPVTTPPSKRKATGIGTPPRRPARPKRARSSRFEASV